MNDMKNKILVGLLFALMACGGESAEEVELGEVDQAYEIAVSSASPNFMFGARRANNAKSLQRCSVSLCGTGLSNRVVVPRNVNFSIGMSTSGGVGTQIKNVVDSFCNQLGGVGGAYPGAAICTVTTTCTSANQVCIGDDSSFFDAGTPGTSSVRRWAGARCTTGNVQTGISYAGKNFDVEVCTRYTVGVSMTRMNAQAISSGQKLELQRRTIFNALMQTLGQGYDTASSGSHSSRDAIPALTGTLPPVSVTSGELCRGQNSSSDPFAASFFDAGCANN